MVETDSSVAAELLRMEMSSKQARRTQCCPRWVDKACNWSRMAMEKKRGPSGSTLADALGGGEEGGTIRVEGIKG